MAISILAAGESHGGINRIDFTGEDEEEWSSGMFSITPFEESPEQRKVKETARIAGAQASGSIMNARYRLNEQQKGLASPWGSQLPALGAPLFCVFPFLIGSGLADTEASGPRFPVCEKSAAVLKTQIPRAYSQWLGDNLSGLGPRNLYFSNSQMIRMLVVWDPYLEKECSKPSIFLCEQSSVGAPQR